MNPMNDAKWYVRIRGRVMGPFDVRQLESLRKRGQFSRFHEVSTDRQTWLAASSVTAVFPEPSAADAVADAAIDQYSLRPQGTPSESVTPLPNARWFYARGDNKMGPVSLGTLQQLAVNGGLGPKDLVWEEGTPEWIPAEKAPLAFPSGSFLPGTSGTEAGRLGYHPAEQGQGATRNSGLAIASLVLGLLWLCGIGSLLAVIFGSVALNQISKSRGRLLGTGMAIAGLVLGIVGLVVVLIDVLTWSLFVNTLRTTFDRL